MALTPQNYISLAEATKYCPHSQEYLSLRARQRKLKAIKIGRNWITKKEWLAEYLNNVEVYNNNLKAKKIVAPPSGLKRKISPKIFQPRFVLTIGLVIVLLITGIIVTKESFRNMTALTAKVSVQDILVSIGDTFLEYGKWLISSLKNISKNIAKGYRAITKLFKVPEKIPEEKLIPKPTKEGLVVIPSTEKDKEIKEKIKESFSDEVKVEPEDETSGIITPVFREREGERYLYILVPIKN